MAIICDVCGFDVTPGKHFSDEDSTDCYEIIEVNGKVCTCINCYMAIGEWITSQECKDYCEAHANTNAIEVGDKTPSSSNSVTKLKENKNG